MLANGRWDLIRRLTLNLLTTTTVAPPSNASKWQMEFNSAFKGLKRKTDFRTRDVTSPRNFRYARSAFLTVPTTHNISSMDRYASSTAPMGFIGLHHHLNPNFRVRHPRCVDIITSIDKSSRTQLLIFVLLRDVFTQLIFTSCKD